MPLRTYLTDRAVDPHISKLKPLSYGIHPSRIPRQVRPQHERCLDLFISGCQNPVRTMIMERCHRLAKKYRVRVAPCLLDENDYLETLQQARLVICTESYGCETWRQYEASAAGAVPFLNWPFTQYHRPFEPDVHAIYFSLNGDHFERQIDWALSHPDLLGRIAATSRQFTLQHKDRRAIGDEVIQTSLSLTRD